MEDRISQLPEPILHQILFLLPQKQAIKTCFLSKSWRYIGTTLPKIEFRESDFRGRVKFVSVVEKTLQRYVDQNLTIQELGLETRLGYDGLLNKWIPIVLLNMGVKTFNLRAHKFSLPPVVFESEILEDLVLKDCKLDRINNCVNVKLHVLKRLELCHVSIEEETFEKIMSSCPLIQHLALIRCKGLRNVKVNKARNLKHFDCYFFDEFNTCTSIEINDDAPSLETISINGRSSRKSHLPNNYYFFPRLKSLKLWDMHLPTEFFDNLTSINCPSLEKLELHRCSGFTELNLSNRSINSLFVDIEDQPIKAATIDAANILYFEFRSDCDLPSISFAPTSREWKSHFLLRCCEVPRASYREFLKAFSQSQISLEVSHLPLMDEHTYDGYTCEPVVVESLIFCSNHSPSSCSNHSPSSLTALVKRMFHICRPAYIRLESRERRLVQTILTIFEKKGSVTRQCKNWEQDLEESSIQVLDENTNEWRSFQKRALPCNKNIRVRLKWRDLN